MSGDQAGVGLVADHWKPMSLARRDGSPVWARGHDWGNATGALHYALVHWDGLAWRDQFGSSRPYLVEWLPSRWWL